MRPQTVLETLLADPPYAAADYFDRDPAQARRQAMRLLAATRCGCCRSPESHLARVVGSVLFSDDDPVALQRQMTPAERVSLDLRSIAACIILYGRPRVSV